jgi:hypothetical protein
MAFGDPTAVREAVRSNGWEHAIETVVADLRYAARAVRHRPGFAVVASLTLALGIGASTAIFSAVGPVLFEPLPYPHADRIVSMADRNSVTAQPLDVTYGTYLEFAARSPSFAALAVADGWEPTMVGRTEPERLAGDHVTPDYFRVLGLSPIIGRDFTAADDQRGAPRVAIASDGFARRHFGTDPAALGRTITLDGNEYTIIGVMPAFDNVLSPLSDVWAPRRYRPQASFDSAEWAIIFG